MKNKLIHNKSFFLFLILWFVINLLQAIYTEIIPDEAYYFLYGKYLDWGYFDHPPFVALLTHFSSILFSGNLGVRFLTVIIQIFTLVLVWFQLDLTKIPEKKKVFMFFIISSSLILFSIYGFITTPDAPLLFFTSLFLFSYQRFIHKKSWLFTFLLAISMAGLVYSKYHGILVIGFVILSNIRLLTNVKFWLAGIFVIFLYSPHIWWQYMNDFPSFRYHIIDRSTGFQWKHVFEFIPGQLAALNPFTLGATIYVMFKYRPVNLFEKAHYFLISGFILFFFATSIRGQVQPQWTVVASISMIILLNNKLFVDPKLFNYVRKFVTLSLILVFAMRILLVTELLPSSTELWGKEKKYKAIGKIAGDKPVIFGGSFQEPSLYNFFTGKPASVISSINIRQTQFNIWKFDHKWAGKIVFVPILFEGKSQKFRVDNQEIIGFFVGNFQSTSWLKIVFKSEKDFVTAGDSLTLNFTISNPVRHEIKFEALFPPFEIYAVFTGKDHVYKSSGILSIPITEIQSEEHLNNQIKFLIPEIPEGKYQIRLSCNSLYGPVLNSNFIKIYVKNR